jgi:nucleoside-diphosphate-sugar epimerase
VLCAELLHRGFKVRALVRSPDKASQLASLGVDIVRGDLHDTAALQQLVADTAAVIHAAGAVRGRSQADFDYINVGGCANILAAIDAHAASARLLLVSSLAASEPQLSWYSASKRAGEDLVRRQPDLDWVVLRPPAVYGPGDKEMLPVFQWMARGIAFVPGSATARTSLVHVTDLVAATIACLQSAACQRQVLSLCDGKAGGYNWHELAAAAGATWQRRVRLWQVPTWLLDTVAQVNVYTARITGAAPMLTPAKLRELRHNDWVVDNAAITAATGWKPTISLAQGLDQLRKAEL